MYIYQINKIGIKKKSEEEKGTLPANESGSRNDDWYSVSNDNEQDLVSSVKLQLK